MILFYVLTIGASTIALLTTVRLMEAFRDRQGTFSDRVALCVVVSTAANIAILSLTYIVSELNS